MIQVAIEERPAVRVAAVRHVGPYTQVGRAFQTLHDIARGAALPAREMLAIFHDDPRTTPEHQLRSDAAAVVAEGVPLPAGLTEIRIPAGRYAKTEHVGSYAGLAAAWTRLLDEWLPQSGYRLDRGLTFEIYRNTPGTVPEAELRTEIYAPVARTAKAAP